MLCYYQTPAMRVINPDFVLLGDIVDAGREQRPPEGREPRETVAIKKANGKYLTVLHDGTDAESDPLVDQEQFIPGPGRVAPPACGVVIADRTSYAEGKAYAVSVFMVNE